MILVLAIGAPLLIWRIAALTKYLPAQAVAAVSSPQEASADDTQVLSQKEPQVRADLDRILAAQEEVIRQPWGRDPFSAVTSLREPKTVEPVAAPPVEAPPAPEGIKVTSVSRSGDRWMAVLRGEIVTVGDRIAGDFEVVEITKNSVALRREGWTYRYQMGLGPPKIEAPGGKP